MKVAYDVQHQTYYIVLSSDDDGEVPSFYYTRRRFQIWLKFITALLRVFFYNYICTNASITTTMYRVTNIMISPFDSRCCYNNMQRLSPSFPVLRRNTHRVPVSIVTPPKKKTTPSTREIKCASSRDDLFLIEFATEGYDDDKDEFDRDDYDYINSVKETIVSNFGHGEFVWSLEIDDPFLHQLAFVVLPRHTDDDERFRSSRCYETRVNLLLERIECVRRLENDIRSDASNQKRLTRRLCSSSSSSLNSVGDVSEPFIGGEGYQKLSLLRDVCECLFRALNSLK